MNVQEILAELRRRAAAEAESQRAMQRCARTRRPGPLGFALETCSGTDRVRELQHTLDDAHIAAVARLTETLRPPGPAVVVDALVDICSDLALAWGGAVLLSLPGVDTRACADARGADWMFDATGLPRPGADIDAAVTEALNHYERAIDEAWGPCAQRPLRRPWKARSELVRGHGVLAAALIEAWDADIARAPADAKAPAPVLQAIRRHDRLGADAANWLAANAGAIACRPASQGGGGGGGRGGDRPQPAAAPTARASSPSPSTRPSSTRVASPAAATGVAAIAKKDPMHWIEIELLGEDAGGIAGEEYLVVETSGREWRGRTDERGLARIDGLLPGAVRVSFPRLDAAAWQRARA